MDAHKIIEPLIPYLKPEQILQLQYSLNSACHYGSLEYIAIPAMSKVVSMALAYILENLSKDVLGMELKQPGYRPSDIEETEVQKLLDRKNWVDEK